MYHVKNVLRSIIKTNGFNNMNLLKYHKDVFFPSEDITRLHWIIEAMNKQNWQYISNHAINELKNDNINLEKVGQFLKDKRFSFGELFEYKLTEERNIYNLVFRVSFNEYQDLVLVVGTNKSLISAWANSRQDKHFTLNTREYQRKD